MNRNLSPLATSPALTADELDEALLRALREDNAVRFAELAASLPVLPVRALIGGEDLLTQAIRLNARHCIEPLFGMGFSMNRPSVRQGLHPLEEAMEARANLTLEYLLDFGADPNAAHSRHGTILRAAALTRTIDSLIPVLCSRGADPNLPSASDGSTALHAAVSRGETLNIEQLLQAGADVNAVDIIGRTPLQFAITRLAEYDPIATILLDHGANPLLPDFGGLTAVDLARVRGETGLIDLLAARVDWEALLAPPDFHPPGSPRPPEVLRTLLLDAVAQGNQRRLRDLFDGGG
ncbi:MAG TPA: ankyrin repeat domain-containing protein, partial [Candidatus Methylacidiphilales bacterium]